MYACMAFRYVDFPAVPELYYYKSLSFLRIAYSLPRKRMGYEGD